MPEDRRRVRLSAAASRDFQDIVRWTAQTFGRRQARAYARRLSATIATLLSGPEVAGNRARDEILPGLRSLHVGKRARHLVLYRTADPEVIEVLRILHDAMELQRHLPGAETPDTTSMPP